MTNGREGYWRDRVRSHNRGRAIRSHVKLIEAGPLVEAAIGVLAPAIVVLRAAERMLEMWRKYRLRFQPGSRQGDQPPG